jgi:hypothetical protein
MEDSLRKTQTMEVDEVLERVVAASSFDPLREQYVCRISRELFDSTPTGSRLKLLLRTREEAANNTKKREELSKWRSWEREMVEFCVGKVMGGVSDQQLRRGIRWHLERLKFKELL